MTEEQIDRIAAILAENILSCTKEVLTSEEAARYMGVKVSYLYKLTMRGEIPHYKPGGKKCYFRRSELERWLTANGVKRPAGGGVLGGLGVLGKMEFSESSEYSERWSTRSSRRARRAPRTL